MLQDEVPPTVFLIRERSSWVTATLFIRALKWLRESIGLPKEAHQVVLLLDCCMIHCTEAVLRAARRLDIWLVFVPKKLTWLLQPCDTHLFRRYRAHMQREVSELRLRRRIVLVDLIDLLRIAVKCVRNVVVECHEWATAFDSNGFGHRQERLSARVRRMRGSEFPPIVGAAPPTEAETLGTLPAWPRLTAASFLPKPPVAACGMARAVGHVVSAGSQTPAA
ncbi:MAG: hypothetical protein GY772_27875, partial [bacterium]|nr:hypothetical protein [bacterium]